MRGKKIDVECHWYNTVTRALHQLFHGSNLSQQRLFPIIFSVVLRPLDLYLSIYLDYGDVNATKGA